MTTVDSTILPAVPVTEPGSILDGIRKRLDHLSDPRRRFVEPIIGVESLVVKYKRLSDAELSTIAQKTQDDLTAAGDDTVSASQAVTGGYMDALIAACDSIHLRQPDGSLKPISEGETVRFDKRLAELLQRDDAKTAREALHASFAHNSLAIRTAYQRLSLWMANQLKDPEEEMAGNS